VKKGRLHLEGPDGPVDLRAKVVQHKTRFSWHGKLKNYQGWHGRLVIDDDGEFEVVAHGDYLDVT
jgi:hypothetical protein